MSYGDQLKADQRRNAVGQQIAKHLEAIVGLYKQPAFVTLLVRRPTAENQDTLLTNDNDIEQVINQIRALREGEIKVATSQSVIELNDQYVVNLTHRWVRECEQLCNNAPTQVDLLLSCLAQLMRVVLHATGQPEVARHAIAQLIATQGTDVREGMMTKQ